MSIWKNTIDLSLLNQRGKNTMVEQLGIEFIEFGDNYLTATMPVDHRTHQPLGIMHGGASCVLAESVGSLAGNYCVDISKFYCVGLSITLITFILCDLDMSLAPGNLNTWGEVHKFGIYRL